MSMKQNTESTASGQFVTATMLSNYFGLTLQCILQNIRKKRIAAIKVGSTYRIPVEEFERIKREGF